MHHYFLIWTYFKGLRMQLSTKKVTEDFWTINKGKAYAGEHVLIDVYGAKDLDCTKKMERVFREAILAANANLLHIYLHHFGEGAGVSGVAVLSESHISVHTWPEREYAAFDIFMCGNAEPDLAVAVIKLAFPGNNYIVNKYYRGEDIDGMV